jgi:hypothetical protein
VELVTTVLGARASTARFGGLGRMVLLRSAPGIGKMTLSWTTSASSNDQVEGASSGVHLLSFLPGRAR